MNEIYINDTNDNHNYSIISNMKKTIKHFDLSNLNHLRDALLVKKLGTGGFSNIELYECKDVHSLDNQIVCNEQFVVKKINFENNSRLIRFWQRRKSSEKSKNLKKLLYHEYDIGKIMCHPNIIKTLDVDGQLNSIILENFVGIDMLDYLNVNPGNAMLIKYFLQVIEAIDYMHDNGIAHMDIKLENILLKPVDHMVKIIDFGHATRFLEDGKYNTISKVYGTEGYFPPEFYTDVIFFPDTIDIWCCGIVLYNLIFDKMPWNFACQTSDNVYAECQLYFKYGKLHPFVFDHAKYVMHMNQQDKEIMDTIFISVFKTEPKQRPNIKKVREMLMRLTFLIEM